MRDHSWLWRLSVYLVVKDCDMKNVFPLIIIRASVNLEGFVFSGSVQEAGLENI